MQTRTTAAAMCISCRKSTDKALEDFTRAYELNPRNARATFMLGSLYEYKGDTTQAISFYEKTLRLDSTFTEAVKALRELKAKS